MEQICLRSSIDSADLSMEIDNNKKILTLNHFFSISISDTLKKGRSFFSTGNSWAIFKTVSTNNYCVINCILWKFTMGYKARLILLFEDSSNGLKLFLYDIRALLQRLLLCLGDNLGVFSVLYLSLLVAANKEKNASGVDFHHSFIALIEPCMIFLEVSIRD